MDNHSVDKPAIDRDADRQTIKKKVINLKCSFHYYQLKTLKKLFLTTVNLFPFSIDDPIPYFFPGFVFLYHFSRPLEDKKDLK